MGTLGAIAVLDKAVSVIDALEAAPLTLAELVAVTGIPRATAHRLAVALEAHAFLARDRSGRFELGPRLRGGGLEVAGRPVLDRLRTQTGESVQIYVRHGDRRRCVAALASPHGLRTIVEVGALLPLDRGSAGRALAGTVTAEGWAESVEEREVGVASVSAPVLDADGAVVAAVSVSGPVERTSRRPGARYGATVVAAAAELAQLLSPRASPAPPPLPSGGRPESRSRRSRPGGGP